MTKIMVLEAFRPCFGMIGVYIGRPPLEIIETESRIPAIEKAVELIRQKWAGKSYKLHYTHDRKPRGWDNSPLRHVSNLVE